MEVRKSLLVAHARERMFDLIEQAEGYPAFLPWCAGATITERSDDVVAATIRVDYHGVRFHFSTRNPKRRPEWLAVHLTEGPFKRFEGEWRLAALGDAGCRVEFALRYEFSSTVMAKLAGPVFERIADTLVDALVAYADAQAAVAPPLPLAIAPEAPPVAPPAAASIDPPPAGPPVAAPAPPPGPAPAPGQAGGEPAGSAVFSRSESS